jgi:hypothetical protein
VLLNRLLMLLQASQEAWERWECIQSI